MKVDIILRQSQTLLDDETGYIYQESVLLPYFVQAWETLVVKMRGRNLSEIRVNRLERTVAKDGTFDPVPDLAEIISIHEKIDEHYWHLLEQVSDLPNSRETTSRLEYYAWVSQKLVFPTVEIPVVVRISYLKIPVTIEDEKTNIDLIGILPYLSLETARLTSQYHTKNYRRASDLARDARTALDDLMTNWVNNSQGIGVRRRVRRRGIAT